MVVRGHQGCKVQLGKDVPVVDQHRAGQQEILHIFQAAGGVQEDRFVAEKHRHPSVARRMGVFRKKTNELVGQTVRVDHDALHARRRKARQGKLAERKAANRDERLGNLVGQRLQSLTPTGAKHKRCPDPRAHKAACSSPPMSRRMVTISDCRKPDLR